MTDQKQGQKRTGNNQLPRKFNRTPKKKGSHYKGKQHGKPTLVKRHAAPANEYICTSCNAQVTKRNRCGAVLVAGARGIPAITAGLGRFKCVCGNNRVHVKKIRPTATEQKVAA